MRAEPLLRRIPRWPRMPLASGLLLGWFAIAAVALTHAHLLPSPRPRPLVAAQRDLFITGHLVAAGVAAWILTAAYRRFGPRRPVIAYLAAWALALVVAAPALREDFSVLAGKLPVPAAMAPPLLVGGATLAVPIAALLGRLLARPRRRALGVVAGVGLAIANHLVLPNDYAGGHLVAAIAAATLIGVALSTARAPRPRRRATLVRLALVPLAAAALLERPSNTVSLELARVPGEVVAPWLARQRALAHAFADAGPAMPVEQAEWFRRRAGHAPVAPTRPSILPPRPVVVLFVIDCMRADLLDRGVRELPTITALAQRSLRFTEARTSAPATTQAMSAVFTGRYYSELYFSTFKPEIPDWFWPHKDTSPRFPELLSQAGVDTVDFTGMPGLMREFGVARGFAEEHLVRGKAGYPTAREIMAPALVRLAAQRADRPLFFYVHFTDAHAPYDHGAKGGTPYQRYLRGLGRADTELAALLARIDTDPKLSARTAVIVTADHGEAFGEHGQSAHATSVYDELLRVPLLVRLPGNAARRIARPVSLLDLAPTILDLFGLPAPGEMMGQSLVPLLAGKDARLTRPIAADSARLQRAMVFPDGMKIIHDRRRDTVELYDLTRDPKETRDLFDASGAEGAARLRALDAFFRTHTFDRPGYLVPFGR